MVLSNTQDVSSKYAIRHRILTRVLEFPSYYTIPLVELQWQIPVTFNPFRVVWVLISVFDQARIAKDITWVHDSLRSRADGDGLFKVRASAALEVSTTAKFVEGDGTHAFVTQATSGEKPST